MIIRWEGDPIFQKEDGTWWFWDEVWVESYGPYSTEDEACNALYRYCEEVLGL